MIVVYKESQIIFVLFLQNKLNNFLFPLQERLHYQTSYVNFIAKNIFSFTKKFFQTTTNSLTSYSNSHMSQSSHLQIYQMLTSLFVTISKGQQIIDSIKQVLTTFDLFHPLVLFKYLTRNQPILQPKHIIAFLQDNNFHAKEEDVRIVFSFEGVKDKMNYSTFLKMIYPYGMAANRQINSVHLKNYHATEKLRVTQEIIACFYLLLTQQIQLINRIEIQKQDNLAHVSKDNISKVLRNIKKLTEKSTNHCQKNRDIIAGLELVSFVKNFTDVEDSSLLYLLRRLGTDHLGSIHVEKLEAFVKPWKKKTVEATDDELTGNRFIEQASMHKRFNEQKYRKQLNSQLQKSISAKKPSPSTKRKLRKEGTINIKQPHSHDKKNQDSAKKNVSARNTPVKDSLKSAKKKDKRQSVNNGVGLFVKFVSVFLKNSAEIERLKTELNKGNQVNYLRIFKNLDTEERGIIQAEQLEKFYKQMGGVNVSINFSVLIEAFSQPGQNWLTYSDFCQIFKPSIQRSQRSSQASPYQGQHSHQLTFSQILYLTLLNEHQLLQIRREFTKGDLFQLFHQINKETTGFINYQELKAFLADVSFGDLSMYELMLVLKRLDKCKNGVVSENQFVDYFLVKM